MVSTKTQTQISPKCYSEKVASIVRLTRKTHPPSVTGYINLVFFHPSRLANRLLACSRGIKIGGWKILGSHVCESLAGIGAAGGSSFGIKCAHFAKAVGGKKYTCI